MSYYNCNFCNLVTETVYFRVRILHRLHQRFHTQFKRKNKLNYSNVKVSGFSRFTGFAKHIRIKILHRLNPRSQLSKWHLRFKNPLRNVVLCSILKWSLNTVLWFSNMVIQIEWIFVHFCIFVAVRSCFSHVRNALSTNASGSLQ